MGITKLYLGFLFLLLLTKGVFSIYPDFWQYEDADEGWGNPNRILDETSTKKGEGDGNPSQGLKESKENTYSYGYGVKDESTGDVKTAYETKENGKTKGSYSILQPDGILRTVTYEADPWNGFRATVYNKGWGLRLNSHGWGGYQYQFKDNRVISEFWTDAINRH